MNVPLRETVSVQLDGFGAGAAHVGPLSAREVWHPSNAAVSVSSAVLEAQCTVFVGPIAYAAGKRGITFTGSSGDQTDGLAGDTVRSGEYVFAQWTGGDPRAIATLTVTGTKDI